MVSSVCTARVVEWPNPSARENMDSKNTLVAYGGFRELCVCFFGDPYNKDWYFGV